MIDCQNDILVTRTDVHENLVAGDLIPQPCSTGVAASAGMPELVGEAGAELLTPTAR